MKKQQGFGVLAALAAVAVVILIAAAGYYVWDKQSDSKDGSPNTSQPSGENGSQASNLTKTHQQKAGKYSFGYPESWLVNTDNCVGTAVNAVMLAPSQQTLGRCGDKLSQVSFVSSDGDQRAAADAFFSDGYKDVKKTNVTVDGQSATRHSGIVTDEPNFEAGTVIVQYHTVVGNRTYAAIYVQQPDWPNELATFDKIMTEAFTIN